MGGLYMSWCHVLVNFLLALMLYLINGWLGNIQQDHKDLFKYGKFTFESNTDISFSGNFFQIIVNPSVFLAIVCAILQQLSFEAVVLDLWLLVPFYWLFRLAFYLVKNLFSFVNWKYEFYSFALSILLSEGTLFVLIRPLIENNESIFLDAAEFRNAFWFALIAYLAKLFWDVSKHHFEGEKVFPDSKRRKIITTRYQNFIRCFGSHIDKALTTRCMFNCSADEENFKCLLYAIMIYEDYCRPPMMRWLEYLIRGLHLKRKMSLGIMQYTTTDIINDYQSIDLAIDKLFSYYSKENNRSAAVSSAIEAYNCGSDYLYEVYSIYYHLIKINGLEE